MPGNDDRQHAAGDGSRQQADGGERRADEEEQTPKLVGHVHLRVRDLDRALSFYREVLGLELTERYNRYAFLSWGERHHDVALQAVGSDAPGPGAGVGLYHVAFEVETASALAAISQRLEDRDWQVSPVDRGISKALYFDDPDGNGIEVYLDTREATGQDRWAGQNDRFDPTELREGDNGDPPASAEQSDG